MNIPTDQEATLLLDEARREQAFWDEQYAHLAQQFPDQFIAVHDGAVVATGRNLEELRAQRAAAGFGPRDTWSRFMMASPIRFVL